MRNKEKTLGREMFGTGADGYLRFCSNSRMAHARLIASCRAPTPGAQSAASLRRPDIQQATTFVDLCRTRAQGFMIGADGPHCACAGEYNATGHYMADADATATCAVNSLAVKRHPSICPRRSGLRALTLGLQQILPGLPHHHRWAGRSIAGRCTVFGLLRPPLWH